MQVSVTVAIGEREVVLEGDCALLGARPYMKGSSFLRDIGFWLENWRYAGHSGPPNKGRVFIPWTSALYVIELK